MIRRDIVVRQNFDGGEEVYLDGKLIASNRDKRRTKRPKPYGVTIVLGRLARYFPFIRLCVEHGEWHSETGEWVRGARKGTV